MLGMIFQYIEEKAQKKTHSHIQTGTLHP